MVDTADNVEYQSLLEAERILDDYEIEVRPIDACAPVNGDDARRIEDVLRHERSNYRAILASVRARASSVRTCETAAMILRARITREIQRLYPALRESR